MARVLAILMSNRPKGFTASVLRAAVKGMESAGGVEVEWVHLHKYKFGPCNSCFKCIVDEPHDCILKDAMGAGGEMMAKVKTANGMFIADPVHMWGPSAMCHLFIERLYPFLFTGELEGMPFASISCASNQGMHRLANRNICKWAFTFGLRYQGGLPVHTTYLERARQEAEKMGRQMAEAAKVDEKGRAKFPDQERYPAFVDQPWSVLEPYLDNLTSGRMTYEDSLIAEGLASFKEEEALDYLSQAKEIFQEALDLYRQNRAKEASRKLAQASALWTHATYKEFIEGKVIKTTISEHYRPLDKE